MRTILVTAALSLGSMGWAQVNVAAALNGGVATQSSLYPSGQASKANDGNRDGRWSQSSVQHTNSETGAWWDVAFASTYVIDQVLIFNRTDCCTTRIDPFSVRLYDENGAEVWSTSGLTHTPDINEANVAGMTVDTPEVLAKRLRIQLDGSNYLHMAEVEAISAVPEPGTLATIGAGLALVARRRKVSK